MFSILAKCENDFFADYEQPVLGEALSDSKWGLAFDMHTRRTSQSEKSLTPWNKWIYWLSFWKYPLSLSPFSMF